jgi:hypothetical protein
MINDLKFLSERRARASTRIFLIPALTDLCRAPAGDCIAPKFNLWPFEPLKAKERGDGLCRCGRGHDPGAS